MTLLSGPLTRRELQIARLLATGKRAEEIARELDIAIKTYYSHRTNIFQKLRIRNTAELAHYAMRQGWLDSTPVPSGPPELPAHAEWITTTQHGIARRDRHRR